MKRVTSQTRKLATAGFTVFELLVVIAIIWVLAATLFPAIAQAKRSSQSVVDTSNMRQLYLAVVMYESDNADKAPWTIDQVYSYVKSPGVFSSPLDPRPLDHRKSGWTVDPCGPREWSLRSSYKISYPYLRSFMPDDTGSGDSFDYYYLRYQPRVGMLASPWIGQALEWPRTNRDGQDDDSTYGPRMSGPVLRIQMDGSRYWLKHRMDEGSFGAGLFDLFFNR